MNYNAIKVHDALLNNDATIPLNELQLFKVVSGDKVLMYMARNTAGCSGNELCDIFKMAASSATISEEDYKLLSDVHIKFTKNPLKFEGTSVLVKADWPAIIAQEDEDVLTTEAEREIKEKGLDANIGFRDIHGNTHSGILKHIIPWTERRSLMSKDKDPEYWIRTITVPEPVLSRNDSIRVPYTEYKRVTDIVLKYRNYPGDRERAAAA